MASQAVALAKRPHVIVGRLPSLTRKGKNVPLLTHACDGDAATPGRIVDHLENTKGFHLRNIQYLIMDEADRILNLDFEKEVRVSLKSWKDRGLQQPERRGKSH